VSPPGERAAILIHPAWPSAAFAQALHWRSLWMTAPLAKDPQRRAGRLPCSARDAESLRSNADIQKL